MAIFLFIVLLIVLIIGLVGCDIGVLMIDDYKTRNNALLNSAEQSKSEVENLKHLRLQDEHNCTVIIKENSKMHELLRDIADRTVTCPLGSEKIVLDKIKELAREYQSKN